MTIHADTTPLALSVDWPCRCESVIIAVYGEYGYNHHLTLQTLWYDTEETPGIFLDRHNFGPKSLKQMREIIEREMGEVGMSTQKASTRCPERATSGDRSCANYEVNL